MANRPHNSNAIDLIERDFLQWQVEIPKFLWTS